MEKTNLQSLQVVSVLKGVAPETMQSVRQFPLIFPKRNCRYELKPGELAFLLSGGARVCRRDGNKTILLNRMQTGDCVGLASLYSSTLPDTEVIFMTGASILVLPREMVEKLIESDAVFSRNIIALLSQKVRFLNTKIAGYTASGSSEKLYRHLLTLYRDGEGCVDPCESLSALARRLGIGRASLYRAIDALVDDGRIEKIGQKYKILTFENKEELL